MIRPLMTYLKNWLVASATALGGVLSVSAFTTNDAATAFTAFNQAFCVNGYYPGWWTGAEEVEMAEDAYDSLPTPERRTIVANACSQFVSHQGNNWLGNDYNDDIAWAVIAFARGYLITGNTTFRDMAKSNWDAMYSRAWDTNFMGGGLWWRNSDKQGKNACVEGPGAIGACFLHQIYGDNSYLSKAQAIYAWERRVLFNTGSGAVSDSIGTNSVYNNWASTYNQGTFIGAANFLYRATGLPFYYQDAILAGKYTQNSMTSGGILPEYDSNSDLSGFNGIFARWMARFAKEQNLWLAFGPWLTTNANAAWSVRNSSNVVWQKWKTPLGTNVPGAWGCSAAVVILQVADPSPGEVLHITPAGGFTAVTRRFLQPAPASLSFLLTNGGVTALNWSLASTSSWLSVSASNGTLPTAGTTNLVISLLPSVTPALSAGRYEVNVWLTNLASGVVANRRFTLLITGADAPMALTGFNARILAPSSATVGVPNATAFDVPNNYCLYQAGLSGSTRGLPPDGLFTSQWDGSTVFRLQPYGPTNALVLGYTYPSSATLTLATPQAFDSLSLLAASANGSGLGTLVLNFANGSHSQALNFNAQDWFTATTNVAIQGIGRLKLGTSFKAEDNGASNPHLYQTTLDLAALGLNQAITSITFTKPANAGAQQSCGVFALSGLVAYREPIITQQPAPTVQYCFAGSTNKWSVVAVAGAPVAYAWCRDGTLLPGATNSTLQLCSLQTTDSGDYTVVLSNAFGMVTSSVASLTVLPAPTYPFGQAVLGDRPVGYWRLDETNGAVAHDSVAGHNGDYTPGVLLGQPGNPWLDTHAAARFGYLSPSNSCVTNLAVDFGTNANAVFSVEAWANGGSQTTDAGLVTKGFGGGGEQFNLDCGGSSHAFRFLVRDGSGNARVAASSVVPNNQWHHLVGVCDQANGLVCLYVDGTNLAQTTLTPLRGLLSSSLPMSIGSRKSGAATAYDHQFTTNLLSPLWQNLGAPIGGRSLLTSPAAGNSFYRINGR